MDRIYKARKAEGRGAKKARAARAGRFNLSQLPIVTKALPPSDPAYPFLGRRSTPLLTRPLPLDLLHTRSLSVHGLHIPHQDTCRHHLLDIVFMRFPKLPLPQANCSSLEVIHRAFIPMTYIRSQHGISPQLSCRPAERLPANVKNMVSRSPAHTFWFGAGGRFLVARMCNFRAMMIHFIFSTSACQIF